MRCNWNLAKTQFGIVLDFFSMKCNWNLTETQFENVLDFFRGNRIGIWLKHNLELS